MWSNADAMSLLHEILNIEGHLGLGLAGWIYPNYLNVLSINALLNDLVQLLLVRQKMPRGI